MTDHRAYAVRTADWARESERLGELRAVVFIEEQHVPPEEEYDGRDPDCVHVVAEDEHGTVIGTGRLLPDGHIGRMAVARAWRGLGVGRALLDALLACARARGFATVELSAQTHAIAFYARSGFHAEGPEFMDAGIPHRRMWRALDGEAS